jgi:hypothetical protein
MHNICVWLPKLQFIFWHICDGTFKQIEERQQKQGAKDSSVTALVALPQGYSSPGFGTNLSPLPYRMRQMTVESCHFGNLSYLEYKLQGVYHNK